jgi:hypothetical protein
MKELPELYKGHSLKWYPVKQGRIYNKLKKKTTTLQSGHIQQLQLFLGVNKNREAKFKAYKIDNDDYVVQGLLCKTYECFNTARGPLYCNSCKLNIPIIKN